MNRELLGELPALPGGSGTARAQVPPAPRLHRSGYAPSEDWRGRGFGHLG
jgi:hypothetical protein